MQNLKQPEHFSKRKISKIYHSSLSQWKFLLWSFNLSWQRRIEDMDCWWDWNLFIQIYCWCCSSCPRATCEESWKNLKKLSSHFTFMQTLITHNFFKLHWSRFLEISFNSSLYFLIFWYLLSCSGLLPKSDWDSSRLRRRLEQSRLCIQCTRWDLARNSSFRESGRLGSKLPRRLHQPWKCAERGKNFRQVSAAVTFGKYNFSLRL